MLILKRKAGERILIGDDIVVEIRIVHGRHAVSVGIQAPPNMRIDREEKRRLQEVARREPN